MNAQERKLIIGYTAHDLNNFPLFAAQAKGFFTEAGKNIELVQIRTDGTASNQGIESVLEVARQQGLAKPVNVADVVDFGPLKEAQAALKLR